MSNHTGNLVKSYYLNRDLEQPRVIETAEIVNNALEKARMSRPQVTEYSDEDYYAEDDEAAGGFQDGLDADTLDALTGDYSDVERDEEGNPVSNIIKAAPREESEVSYAVPEEIPYMGPSPEELIAQAQAEIDGMRIEAQAEMERQQTIALEEARSRGYNEGKARADAEIAAARADLERERHTLESQYAEQVELLEPEFIHVLTGIYEKIFEVDLSNNRDLIISLLHNAMGKIENCRNYLIHVSHDDFEYVSENKNRLMGSSMVEGTTIDVVEDLTLRTNECMIETVNGIFDCSLGTELEALRRKLELLSYTPD